MRYCVVLICTIGNSILSESLWTQKWGATYGKRWNTFSLIINKILMISGHKGGNCLWRWYIVVYGLLGPPSASSSKPWSHYCDKVTWRANGESYYARWLVSRISPFYTSSIKAWICQEVYPFPSSRDGTFLLQPEIPYCFWGAESVFMAVENVKCPIFRLLLVPLAY